MSAMGPNSGIDCLWAVGASAALVAEEAVRQGMPAANVRHHVGVDEALAEPAFDPQPGDSWLFKASRGMRLERLVERVRAMLPHDSLSAHGRLGHARG